MYKIAVPPVWNAPQFAAAKPITNRQTRKAPKICENLRNLWITFVVCGRLHFPGMVDEEKKEYPQITQIFADSPAAEAAAIQSVEFNRWDSG